MTRDLVESALQSPRAKISQIPVRLPQIQGGPQRKPSQKSAGLLESAGNPKRRWAEGYPTPAASPQNGTEGDLRKTNDGAVVEPKGSRTFTDLPDAEIFDCGRR